MPDSLANEEAAELRFEMEGLGSTLGFEAEDDAMRLGFEFDRDDDEADDMNGFAVFQHCAEEEKSAFCCCCCCAYALGGLGLCVAM